MCVCVCIYIHITYSKKTRALTFENFCGRNMHKFSHVRFVVTLYSKYINALTLTFENFCAGNNDEEIKMKN